MVNKTKIEWCDYTANPIRYRRADDPTGQRGSMWACVKASEGCQHCYAETLAKRFQGREFTASAMRGVVPYVDEGELRSMLSPRRLPPGSRCFVGDMTDVFGEWVPFGLLYRLFRTIWSRPDVIFQILTKRPERMRKFFEMWNDLEGEDFGDFKDARGPAEVRERHKSGRAELFAQYVESLGEPPPGAAYPTFDWMEGPMRWPRSTAYPNVWLGTSVEDQRWADVRIPELLATPAAVRFVSAEPLLGPVDLEWCAGLNAIARDWAGGPGGGTGAPHPLLDWVIVGGESGPGARPCDVAWVRSVVSQCRAAGVAVFCKQLGSKPYTALDDVTFGPEVRGAHPDRQMAWVPRYGQNWGPLLRDPKGADPEEWPEDLKVREMPR